MRRFGTPLISVGAVVLVVAFGAMGEGSRGEGLAVAATSLLLVGSGTLLRRLDPKVHGDAGWGAASTSSPGMPLQRSTPTNRRAVIGSLLRIEVRELASGPWFGVGVGFWVLVLFLVSWTYAADQDGLWLGAIEDSLLFVHPFVGMVIIGAHRAVTRSRRDGCDELFDTCPLDRGSRLLAHLGTAWLPVAISVAAAVVGPALIAYRNPYMYGPLGIDAAVIVATVAILTAGGVFLGVALGRVVPWLLAPIAAIVAVGVVDDALLNRGAPRWATDRMLATLKDEGTELVLLGGGLPFAPRLLWFGALTALVGALALVGLRRWAVPVVGGAVTAAVVGTVLVAAPLSNPGDLAAALTDPDAHQQCVPAAADLVVCGYDATLSLAEIVADELRPVAAATPAEAVRTPRFVQRFDAPHSALPIEVYDRIGRIVPVDEDHIRYKPSSSKEQLLAVRFRYAARALGLPAEVARGLRPTVVAGQARGVVVLWLATRGLSDREVRDALDNDEEPPSDERTASHIGQIWPAVCQEENAGGALVWAPEDLEAARRLFTLPDEEVARLLDERWDELTSRDTTTDALLEAAGLDGVGPTTAVGEGPHVCPY